MIDSWKMSIVILLALGALIITVNSIDFGDDGDLQEEGKGVGNASEYTNQNQEFMKLIKESDNVLENDRSNIAFYLENNDMYNLSKYSKIYKEDSEKYINQMKSLTLSSSHGVILEEYLKFLESAYLTGKYIEEGANTGNSTMISMGISYNADARNNIANVSGLIKESG